MYVCMQSHICLKYFHVIQDYRLYKSRRFYSSVALYIYIWIEFGLLNIAEWRYEKEKKPEVASALIINAYSRQHHLFFLPSSSFWVVLTKSYLLVLHLFLFFSHVLSSLMLVLSLHLSICLIGNRSIVSYKQKRKRRV